MMKFQKFDRRSGEMVDLRPTLCEFGITEALVPLITTLATSAGIGATTAGVIGSIAAPALVSAGLGAGTSALFGGNIGQGALLGGLGGALGPALNAVGITSGGVANALGLGGNSGSGALTGAAAQALESGNTGASAAGNMAGSALDAEGNPISSYATGAAGMDPATNTAAKTAAGISTQPGTGGAVHGLGLGNVVGLLGALASQAQRPATTQATPPPGFSTPWNPNPSSVLGRTANPFTPAGGSYYTYGQQAQPQFFNNNQLTFPQPQMAKGGALRHAIRAGQFSGGALNQFSAGGGNGHVQGDGDGTSDDIPARLSNDEYVLTAADVSRIGQGSTDAGVQKLNHMREQIANDAGAKKFQGKVKPPLSYLREAA